MKYKGWELGVKNKAGGRGKVDAGLWRALQTSLNFLDFILTAIESQKDLSGKLRGVSFEKHH